MTESNDTKEALAGYLKTMHWDAFFTATFAKEQRYSATAMDKVHRVLSEPRLRPTKMFIAAEQHYLGGWHCHGLIEFPPNHHQEHMIDYQKVNLKPLGFSKVSLVASLDAASVYLSKYLVKDDFHGDWRTVGRKKFWQVVNNAIPVQ